MAIVYWATLLMVETSLSCVAEPPLGLQGTIAAAAGLVGYHPGPCLATLNAVGCRVAYHSCSTNQ
jgi:hypothetical protein